MIRSASAPFAGSVRRQPVLAAETIDSTEVVEISRHDNEAATARVPGDQDVIRADEQTLALEVGINITGMGGRIFVE